MLCLFVLFMCLFMCLLVLSEIWKCVFGGVMVVGSVNGRLVLFVMMCGGDVFVFVSVVVLLICWIVVLYG